MSTLNIQAIQDQVREPGVMNSVAGWFIGMEDYGMITKAISYAAWFFVEIALCVPVITIPLFTRLVEEYTIRRNDAALQQHLNDHPDLLPDTTALQSELATATRLKLEAEACVGQKDTELGQLRLQLEQANNSVSQKNTEIGQLQERIRALSEESLQASQRAQAAETAIGQVSPRLQTATQRVGELENANQRQTEQLSENDRQIALLRQQVETLNQEKTQLSDNIPGLKEQIEQANQAQDQAKEALREANQRSEEASRQAGSTLEEEQRKYSVLEQTVQQLRDEISRFPQGEVIPKDQFDTMQNSLTKAMLAKEEAANKVLDLEKTIKEYDTNKLQPIEERVKLLQQQVLDYNQMKQKFESALGMLEALKSADNSSFNSFKTSGEFNGLSLDDLKNKTV